MHKTIGLRREDLDKRGEQRVALPPSLAKKLIEAGHTLLVQSQVHPETGAVKRAFTDDQYREIGATLTEDLSESEVIFGLKEVKHSEILPKKAYAFFSHTHKGQVKNRPLLQTLVDQQTTLIDYELIASETGQRLLTAFTFMAGYAGMIDSLWAYGKKLALSNKSTQWERVLQSVDFSDLNEAKECLRKIGEHILTEGTDHDLPPLICVFLGNGRTSKGAQEIFDILPSKEISIEEVEHIFRKGSRKQVYKLVLDIPELFRFKETSPHTGNTFSRQGLFDLYFQEPEHFESNLDRILPYTTLLMNCILWAPQFPRLLSREQAGKWIDTSSPLAVIGDITCDPEGSIQFSKETWIDDPVFTYIPSTEEVRNGFQEKGITVMAVTNLPCEFSADSSHRFGADLEPFLMDWLAADFSASTVEESGLPGPIQRAVILWKGNFTPAYKYMKEFIV